MTLLQYIYYNSFMTLLLESSGAQQNKRRRIQVWESSESESEDEEEGLLVIKMS